MPTSILGMIERIGRGDEGREGREEERRKNRTEEE